MKTILLAISLLALSMLLVSCPGDDVTPPQIKGCMNVTSENYNPQANVDCDCCIKRGSVLFWTDDQWMLPSCGIVTIKLDNGQQTNVTGFYFTSPPDCVNRFGGYLSVEEGSYSYTVVSGNGACSIPGGTIKVIANTCNMFKIN